MASTVATDETQLKYDVFISFSGFDTRHDFTSHLHAALKREKIHAFIDTTFPRGLVIVPSLLKAIKESEVAVIIFSQSYGGSSYCLDELVEILKYKDLRGMVVLPVFYYVNPIDVDERSGVFGDEFKKLKDEGNKWSEALKIAANISGFVWKDFRPDAVLVEEVVKVVKSVIRNLKTSVSSLSADLVGMELHIKEMLKLLQTEKKNVLFLGIWGMGGIGKTTCAKALFHQIAGDFESCYFQADVREESRKHPSGFLQNKILGEILNMEKTPNIVTQFDLKRLSQKKVLIILDDVSETERLEIIAGKHDWYGPGSRIIVTSRNKQVLENGGCVLYEVGGLSDKDSLRLFCSHAFKSSTPDASYLKLSEKAVHYAGGVPLALEVLGCHLYKKPLDVWESKFDKLSTKLEGRVSDILGKSYEELDGDERNIFLDIACFFKGRDKELVTDILDGCGFHAGDGISRLVDKCLITIAEDKTLQMHDLVQEMGKEIVREESKNCRKRSRLWKTEEILPLLTRNKVSELTEGIVLDTFNVRMGQVSSVPLSFSNMPNLRLLLIYDRNVGGLSGLPTQVYSSHSLPYLPSNLSYLHWMCYPWKSLHDDFSPLKLVYLHLQYGNIERLWSKDKVSPQLKRIDISHSNLISLPDLSSAVYLEEIILDSCGDLCEISNSLRLLKKLVHLSLLNCWKVKSLPNLVHLKLLQTLNLADCSSLEEFPSIGCYTSLSTLDLSYTCIKELPESLGQFSCLVKLNLKSTKIEELPTSMGGMTNLLILDLSNCTRLKTLPSSICELKSLKELYLYYSGIQELPESLGSLSALQRLSLKGTSIQQIPPSIDKLDQLEELIIRDCKTLQYLPKLPCSVNFVDSTDCLSLENVAISLINVVEKASKRGEGYVFLFSNCIKLDDSSRENIMRLLRHDQDIGTTLSRFSATSEYPGHPKFMISLSGTTIPKWFQYKNKDGSYVDANFRDCCYKMSSIGLTFGVLVEWPRSDGNMRLRFTVRCECHLSSGVILDLSFNIKEREYRHFHSDHVFIWMVRDLQKSTESDRDYLTRATFEVSASNIVDNCNYEVKMCGVHVVHFSGLKKRQFTSGESSSSHVSTKSKMKP